MARDSRSMEELARAIDGLRSEIASASSTQKTSSKEQVKASKGLSDQLLGAAQATLAGMGAAMGYAAVRGFANPYMGAAAGAEDIVWKGVAKLGGGTVQEQALGMATGQVGQLAEMLARAGTPMTGTEMARSMRQYQAFNEPVVEAQLQMEAIEARMRKRTVGDALPWTEPLSEVLAPAMGAGMEAGAALKDTLGDLKDKLNEQPLFGGGN